MSAPPAAAPRPAVSVVVPMLNAQAYVEQALHSILAEREIDLEVVVVDDGSTDRSRELVQSIGDHRVRIIDGPRRGISASLNAGLKAAAGDILMRCDADDLYPHGRIRRQFAWLRDHPEHDAVCGAFSTIDTAGHVVAEVGKRNGPDHELIDAELSRGMTRTHLCTFAIRRRVFDRIGTFREYFETAEDLDFQLRMGEVFKVCYVPVDDYFYRLHDESITHSRSSVRRQFFDRAAVQFQEQRLLAGNDALDLGHPPVPPSPSETGPRSALLHVHGMLVGQSWRDLDNGQVRSGVGRAWRAVKTHPLHLRGWMNFAKILYRAAFPK
jgi:glycosyltransferase involved in cell wall biosynthesis